MARMVPYRRKNGLVFNDGFSDMYNMIDNFFNEPRTRSLENISFKVDIKENDEEYIIEAEMPGYDKEDIEIKVKDDSICISASKDEEIDKSDEENKYIHKERKSSNMVRTMSFVDMDPEKLAAKLDKGILTINVSKRKENDNTRTLEIE